MKRVTANSISVATIVVGLAAVAFSQTAVSPQGLPAVGAEAAAGDPNAATDAAERDRIWNSPTMLRARAWVQEYCQRSARISPAEAKQYMNELEHMSPVQMKLWLLKFDHEEETIRQQQADFQRSRQAGVAQSVAIHGATAQAYSDINRDETEAAESEESSISAEAQLAGQRDLRNDQGRIENNAALGGPLYGPYGGGLPLYGDGYNPLGAFGAGDIHIHVHPR